MDRLSIANLAVETLLACLSIVGNLFVLLALRADRRLHTVTNVLVASLAVADLLVGVVIGPLLLPLFGLPRHFYLCLLVNCLIVMLTGASVLNLLAVTSERYIAIKFPFWYNAHFSRRTAFSLAVCGWLLGIFLGMTPLYGWNNGWNDENTCSYELVISLEQHVYVQFFGVICLPLMLMLAIYMSIFVEVRRISRQIASLNVMAEGNHQSNMNCNSSEVRAARRFALVVGSFVLCWFPLELQNCVFVWSGAHCVPCATVSVWLSHLNSGLNPLLFAYGNSRLRRAMARVLLCRPLPAHQHLAGLSNTTTSIPPPAGPSVVSNIESSTNQARPSVLVNTVAQNTAVQSKKTAAST